MQYRRLTANQEPEPDSTLEPFGLSSTSWYATVIPGNLPRNATDTLTLSSLCSNLHTAVIRRVTAERNWYSDPQQLATQLTHSRYPKSDRGTQLILWHSAACDASDTQPLSEERPRNATTKPRFPETRFRISLTNRERAVFGRFVTVSLEV